MSQKYLVEGWRTVNTYAYMRAAASHSLDCGKRRERGSFYQFMSSLIFSAFTLEAYMNHLGSEKVEYWKEIESIRHLDKLKILYLTLDLDFDQSKRPLQTITKLVKFRNFIAHGKTEKLSGSKVISTPSLKPGEEVVDAKFTQLCNSNEAEQALKDVIKIIEKLNSAADDSNTSFLWSLGGGGSVTSSLNP